MLKSRKIYVDTGNLSKSHYYVYDYQLFRIRKFATLLSIFRQKRAQKTSQSLRQGGLKFKYEKKRFY